MGIQIQMEIILPQYTEGLDPCLYNDGDPESLLDHYNPRNGSDEICYFPDLLFEGNNQTSRGFRIGLEYYKPAEEIPPRFGFDLAHQQNQYTYYGQSFYRNHYKASK